jgi:hypothetical protein
MFESGTGDLEERIARLEQQDERLTRALELLARSEPATAMKRRRDWDAFAAVIASLIGLLALAVSGYTAYVQRQQLRAQVWPHVELEYSNVNLGFFANNQGTGPARVIAMRVAVDGAPRKTWSDVRKVAGITDDKRLSSSTLSESVLPSGKVFTIAQPGDDEESRAAFKALLPGAKHAISVTICYCSVLDDCWVASLDAAQQNGELRSRDSCPIRTVERFRD